MFIVAVIVGAVFAYLKMSWFGVLVVGALVDRLAVSWDVPDSLLGSFVDQRGGGSF
jgi:hypothetical protein